MAEHGFNDPTTAASAQKVPLDYSFTSPQTILGLNSAFENLFELSLMHSNADPLLSDFPVTNIKGIKIGNFSFDLKRDTFTRKHKITLDSLKYYDNITIDWMEDDSFSVFDFHKKWKSLYYDESKQTWVVGPYNRYINLKLKIQSSSPNILSPRGEGYKTNQLVFELRNIALPKNLPSFDLQYSKSDEIAYSISYPVEKIESFVTLDASERAKSFRHEEYV